MVKESVRLGFIIGKYGDDPIKYNKAEFKGVPKKYKLGGDLSVDAAIPWYISKHWDAEVDIILPSEITLSRLKQNDLNFLTGYDLITEFNEDLVQYRKIKKIFENSSAKLWPRWKTQNFIYNKGDYAAYLGRKGIPVAPSIQVKKKLNDAGIKRLVNKLHKTGWGAVIAKPELSGWSFGIEVFKMEDVTFKTIKKYLRDNKYYPRFIFQEALRGFAKKWEIRLFYFNGKFKYAIGNKAAIATGWDEIITSNPPAADLKRVIKIGNKIMKLFPKTTIRGKKIEPSMIRMDFGCCLNNTLNSKDYFLNEIENQACNYFARHVKFDMVPEYSKLYVNTAEKVLGTKIQVVGKQNKGSKRRRRRSRKLSNRRSKTRRRSRRRRSKKRLSRSRKAR
jgi:hypothetical protein